MAIKKDAPKSGDDMAAATDFEASGAIIEPGAKDAVDMKHPAVDSNPRAGVPADSNRIDFNDPTKSQKEAVADNLKSNDMGGRASVRPNLTGGTY